MALCSMGTTYELFTIPIICFFPPALGNWLKVLPSPKLSWKIARYTTKYHTNILIAQLSISETLSTLHDFSHPVFT